MICLKHLTATFNAGITATTGTFSGAISGTQLSINENIIFEGATANDFETTPTSIDPTADRTLTLPDETGTIATRGFCCNGNCLINSKKDELWHRILEDM